MAQKYKNIPVSEDTYIKVQKLAEANGFGQRGLGAQVDFWAEQELPPCDHEKVSVTVEKYPAQEGAMKNDSNRLTVGWLCATCNRVYQYSAHYVGAKPKKNKLQMMGDR